MADRTLLTGNFAEIYDVNNIRWHHEVIKKYGGALLVNGILGVRSVRACPVRSLIAGTLAGRTNILHRPARATSHHSEGSTQLHRTGIAHGVRTFCFLYLEQNLKIPNR